ELPGLRMVETSEAARDSGLELTSEAGEAIARFAWTPSRPGTDLLRAVVPFLAITVACLMLLAGFMLRYMRRTTAAIAAGEARRRRVRRDHVQCLGSRGAACAGRAHYRRAARPLQHFRPHAGHRRQHRHGNDRAALGRSRGYPALRRRRALSGQERRPQSRLH